MLPTKPKPPKDEKLAKVLGFLVSADEAVQGGSEWDVRERLAVTRRAIHHGLANRDVTDLVRQWSRASVWEQVRTELGVSPDLAAALGVATEDGGQQPLSPEQRTKVENTVQKHDVPVPRGTRTGP